MLVPGTGLGAFTAATAPISEQAVVAGNTSGSGLSTTVVLSAPAGPARVRLTELTPAAGSAQQHRRRHRQPAGHRPGLARTLAVPMAAPRGGGRGAAFAVVITPLAGSGPLYAARVQTQGQSSVVSIIPAVSALTTVSLPPVRDSYAAISP